MLKTSLLKSCACAFALTALASPLRAEVHFTYVDLDSDLDGVGRHTDTHLVNPRGVVPDELGNAFIANNATGTLTTYDAAGRPLPLVAPIAVTVPVAAGATGTGTPTGLVFNAVSQGPNAATDFAITANGKTGSSVFLTVTEDGQICGYNPSVDANNAISARTVPGSDYEGVALSHNAAGKHQLYAANFATGTIDVFDATFLPVVTAGGFVDANAVAGYAPFNIKRYSVVDRAVAGKIKRFLLVAYAKKTATGNDVVAGAGLGYINVFDSDGNYVTRLVSLAAAGAAPNALNVPWGMAVARHTPGRRDDVLFVANHGDGLIQRYSLGNDFSGAVVGPALQPDRSDLAFNGLWDVHFGRVPASKARLAAEEDDFFEEETLLHFTAGLADDTHGLAGRIFRR